MRNFQQKTITRMLYDRCDYSHKMLLVDDITLVRIF